MIDRKVVVMATGGTIAMKYDEASGGLVPACTGRDLADAVPGLGDVAALEFIQFSNIASCGMEPQAMWRLHLAVEEVLSRDDVAGVVITHGTDTAEETAFLLEILRRSDKPVVVTAAMRGAADTSPDGPMNIYCSVMAASSPESVGMGVLVCLNETLFAAEDATKTHSANPATFQAPWWGPVGYVDKERVIYRFARRGRRHFSPKALTARVDIVKCMTGSDRSYIDFAVSQGCSAVVVEGFGRGNIPPPMVPGIRDAVARGVAVVVVSRTLSGRVLDVYGYPGSVTHSRAAGAAMGCEFSAAKARLLLMAALSENPALARDRDAIERLFE